MKKRLNPKHFIFLLAAAAAFCFSESRADALEVRARNDFDQQLAMAFVYHDDDAGAWMTRGWYLVGARSSKTIKFETSEAEIYIYSQLADGETTWGKGDLSRVVISQAFGYRDGAQCPSGTNRRTVKFTKYTAKGNAVSYRPEQTSRARAPRRQASKPLPTAGGASAPARQPGNRETGNTGSAGLSPSSMRATVNNLAALINYERQLARVPELRLDEALMKAAERRAVELTRKYSHTRPDGRDYHTVLSEFGLEPLSSAENIAYRGDDSALEVNEQFVNSPGHKKNMLGTAYSRIGVAVQKSGGRYYWVELFAGEEVSSRKEKSLGDSFDELKKSLKALEDLF
jgi:uncharacterized protein YkwD